MPARDILQIQYLFRCRLGLDNFAQNTVDHMQLGFFHWSPWNRTLEASEIFDTVCMVFRTKVGIYLSENNLSDLSDFESGHKNTLLKRLSSFDR